MTIKETERKFKSDLNHCPFCDNSLSSETEMRDHLNQIKTTIYDYTCSCQITKYEEQGKTIQIQVKDHCTNQTEALHKLLKIRQ